MIGLSKRSLMPYNDFGGFKSKSREQKESTTATWKARVGVCRLLVKNLFTKFTTVGGYLVPSTKQHSLQQLCIPQQETRREREQDGLQPAGSWTN